MNSTGCISGGFLQWGTVQPFRHEDTGKQIACAVGRLCVNIFGEPTEQGRILANAQGRAKSPADQAGTWKTTVKPARKINVPLAD